MPQKKNPDLAELIRGKTGRLISSFINMSIVMKGLPLAYSKDLQEDKEPTFDAIENIELCLQSMTAMIASLKTNKENMELAASSQYSTATDLADWLVQNLNIPFRTAHEITGRIVKICVDENITLEQIGIEKLKKIDKRINKEIYKALNVRDSVERKISEGGTSPKNVLKQASRWIKRLENDK
jgi:argininosuccinate lyase